MKIPHTTQAAVLIETGKPLEIIELILPELKPGQALVEINYAGVCHTQLHEIRGRRGPDRFLPHTLGHEGAGTVLSCGDGVAKVKPGDRVVMTWIKGDGADVAATTYDSPIGTVNSGAISTFMTHSIISENRLVPVNETPMREAALLGCAVPTGAGMVMNTVGVQPGMSVAVFGIGGIGLSAVLASAMCKADTIIAVDILENKLEAALRAGATHTINAAKEDTLLRIQEITEGHGVDAAFEAAGLPDTMETAFGAVAYGGGICILAGNVSYGEKIQLDPFDLIKGRRIAGTWGGETEPDSDIPYYASLFESGKFPIDQLASHEWPLDMINTAFDELEAGNVSRALIRIKETR